VEIIGRVRAAGDMCHNRSFDGKAIRTDCETPFAQAAAREFSERRNRSFQRIDYGLHGV
jgi:hypothetical protein